MLKPHLHPLHFIYLILDALDISFQPDASNLNLERLRRVSSSTSISSMSSGIHNPYGQSISSLGYASAFGNIWKTLIALSNDPYPHVSKLSERLVNYIKLKVMILYYSATIKVQMILYFITVYILYNEIDSD